MTVGMREAYTVTYPHQAQACLLAALAMEDLARDDLVATQITPR